MEQTKNKNAFLTQVLVRNYLLTENKDSNINIYGEMKNKRTFANGLSLLIFIN